jgi:hypothetical protein
MWRSGGLRVWEVLGAGLTEDVVEAALEGFGAPVGFVAAA